MEKKKVFSSYIDAEKGKIPVTLNIKGYPRKGSMKVSVKPRNGSVKLNKEQKKMLQKLGEKYVKNAQKEMRIQGLRLGMTAFTERFPLISIALQDPNLYLARLFSIFTNGLKNRDIKIFMALMDTAYKAKEGALPDPLPKKLRKKIKLGQYKNWGKDVTQKIDWVAKKFGSGTLDNDFFTEMNTKDLQTITKLTNRVAEFYADQAKKSK